MVTRAFGSLVGCLCALGVATADSTPAPQARTESPPPSLPNGGYSVQPPGSGTTGASSASTPNYSETCDLDCTDCLCGPNGRVWASAEWLYWAVAGNPIPTLVTQSPAITPRSAAGVLGVPTTVTVFGGRRVNNDVRNGFRARAGVWLGDCQRCGIEGDYFFLSDSTERFIAGSPDGSAVIGRPFFNVLTGAPAAELVSFPGVVAGSVGVESTSEFHGWGARFVKNLCCDPCGYFNLTFGYRSLSLTDNLTITEDLTALAQNGVTPGTRFVILDRFRTENQFYGPSLGVNFERRRGPFFVDGRASVALGVTRQEVTIEGATAITPPGGPTITSVGGLLAQPTNIGQTTDHVFTVVPEFGIRFGAQLTPGFRAFVGYDFIYWSDVARAGDQIDLRLNTNQLPPPRPLTGPAVPARTGHTTDLWVQGVSVGLELRY